MAQSFACCTFPQNTPLGGKNKLAGAATTKGNNIPAVLRALNPVLTVTPPIVSTLSSAVQYLENNL